MTPAAWWRVVLAVAVTGEAALTAALFGSDLAHRDLWWLAGAAALAVVAVVALRNSALGERSTVAVVLLGGVVLQCAALGHGPLTSDDLYRYVWDAKVQLAGVDPYRYVPSAPQLASLRDSFLFGPGACTHAFDGGCTLVNRPDVHTIYPPVAQAAFVVLRWLSFGGTVSYQVWAAVGTVAVAGVLVGLVRRAGRPVWLVALWSWSPLVVTEYGNNAHVDWLAVLLSLLAVSAAMRGRDLAAGAWVGAAAAVKLYPAVLVAALVRRRPWSVVVGAVAVFTVGYVPHVLAVGGAVVGFLPHYLGDEGYASGTRLLLLGAVLPRGVDLAVGALVLVATAVWCVRRSTPTDPARTAVVLVGVVFLVTTPSYGWYAGLLLALAVVAGRWEWSAVALAPTVTYLVYGDLTRQLWPGTVAYAVAGLVVVVVTAARSVHRDRPADRDTEVARTPVPVEI